MTLTIGELCAGYTGLGMGIEAVLDAETAWVADVCKFDKNGNAGHHEPHRSPCTILEHRYPGVPNIGDITRVDWSTVTPVNIIAGGTPCQDLSHAGKRAGMSDGTRSNLWVAMREAIALLRPSLVVWENVGGAASAEADSEMEPCPGCMGDPRDRGPVLRALGRVVGDLSSLGYVGSVRSIRAADVDAPHGRLRYFLAAHPEGDTRWIEHRNSTTATDSDGRIQFAGSSRPGERTMAQPNGGSSQPDRLLPSPRASDTNGAGQHGAGGLDLRTAVSLLPTPSVSDGTGGHLSRSGDRSDELLLPGVAKSLALLPTPRASHWAKTSDRAREKYGSGDSLADVVDYDTWGNYAPAIARWEAETRPAPAPVMVSETYRKRIARRRGGTDKRPIGMRGSIGYLHRFQLSPAFSEWMMGLPAGWVTDTPGITRNDALKALGNGVVPQQAAAALADLLDVLEGRQAA